MREIEFRGLAMSGGWVYGNYIHSKRFEGCSNEYRIHNVETGLESDVYPETVGQFTGLKDKNGVEIYEGDIIKHDNFDKKFVDGDKLVKVIFDNGAFGYIDFIDGNFYPLTWDDYFYKGVLHKWEVIGNIHENPELLK